MHDSTKMNRDSNKYIFLYSVGLVAVAAILLSLAAIWLAPYQQRNAVIEKKFNILQAVRKADSADITFNKNAYIEQKYARYITYAKIVNAQGTDIDGNAFDVSLDEELVKPTAQRRLPVFVCTNDDSSKLYILPLRGAGLWGPIWGYISLHEDMNTIYGVVFDHKSETPGLGAEIASHKFQQQFAGKTLFDGETFTSIAVKKGEDTKSQSHAVDAVSGGTITSEGLQKMISEGLTSYLPFLKIQQKINDEYMKSNEILKLPIATPKPIYYSPRPEPTTDVSDAAVEPMPHQPDTMEEQTTEDALPTN